MEGTEIIQDVNKSSRTELDSHANMPVIGINAYILSKIGETADVAPFTLDYKPISVELVDAALKNECPYSGKIKILIIRRGLYVPSMTNNLLPPFMISSLALCDKEQMFISSHFVDQDEDINTVPGFEDENQLYHALDMRNEHGQFAMNIGATSIFDQLYLNDDDSQDTSDDDDTS